ncbi:MAG TPA: amidohydrolase family protein, partial [Vicinamibacterales bacterium]|nr:amidohydrolase family protein [Vicinamibacterales bacterium]
LATATTTAAALLGLGDQLGRLAPGFLADIIALDGDPTSSLAPLMAGPVWVMKDGRVVVSEAARSSRGVQ